MGREGLVDAVAKALLPSGEEMRLLRLCLVGGNSARLDAEEWLASMADPRQRLGALDLRYRRMLALVHDGVTRNGVAATKAVSVYLRIAETRERARNQAYWQQCNQVLSTLRRVKIEAVPIRGAAAALHAYPELYLRHSHDVDLLLPEGALYTAVEALEVEGFERCSAPLAGSPDHVAVIRHPSGLEFVLHSAVRRYTGALETFDAARRHLRDTRFPTLPGSITVPSLELTLVHALQDLYCRPSPKSLFLFIDLWFLLRRAEELDWTTIAAEARARGLCASCLLVLDFLDRLGAPAELSLRRRLLALGAEAERSEYVHLAQWLGNGKCRLLGLLVTSGAGLPFIMEYASRGVSRFLRQRGAAVLRHG